MEKFACKRPKNNQLAVGAPLWWPFLSNDNVHTVIPKCKRTNDKNIIVNSGISPSANVMAAAKKMEINVYLKILFTCLENEIPNPLLIFILRLYLKPKTIDHLKRIEKAAAAALVKGLRDFTSEKRFKQH